VAIVSFACKDTEALFTTGTTRRFKAFERIAVRKLQQLDSAQTLEFLRWLGVEVPRWIENDLRHATNPLAASLEQAATSAAELIDYCRRLGVPFGLNVESVSIRREEIEAAVELAAHVAGHLRT